MERLEEVTRQAMQDLDPAAAETLRTVMESDLQGLESGSYPESCEYYAPYIHDRFATLIDYIPDNALVLFDEWDSIMMSLQSYEEKLNATFTEGLQTGRLLPLPRPLHVKANDIALALNSEQRVYLSSLPLLDKESNHRALVQFECRPIERFGNNMQLLMEKIRQWRAEGNRILVSTEQPQRLLGLLREWDCEARYLPGPTEGVLKELKPDSVDTSGDNLLGDVVSVSESDATNAVWVTRHGFVHGFRLDDTRLVCVTDAEMFGLKRKPTVYRRPTAEKTLQQCGIVMWPGLSTVLLDSTRAYGAADGWP